jgi:hypothetical protein
LGLPLLLAEGRDIHAIFVHDSRVLRGGEGLEQLATSCGRGRPQPASAP